MLQPAAEGFLLAAKPASGKLGNWKQTLSRRLTRT
jgi:hypothetical protein